MTKARILIAYYSRSGTTRTVAEALAKSIEADLEPIVDSGKRDGAFGFLRSIVEAVRKRPAAIAPAKKDPSAYDLVVVGTPVWAGAMSSPVRAYLMANRARLHQIGLFCTLGGRDGHEAIAQMEELAGHHPAAWCSVPADEVAKGQFDHRLAKFAVALRHAAQTAHAGMAQAA